MRRGSVLPALLALVVSLGSCKDRQPLAPDREARDVPVALSVSDASRGGNPGFFLLPPLGPEPQATGEFDDSHSPIVELCAWGGLVCDGHPLLSEIALSGEGESYRADLRLGDAGLSEGTVYRIRVLVQGNVLGFVDVASSGGGLQLARSGVTADEDDVVRVAPNQTLVVRFRIDEGAIALPTATFSVGGSSQARVGATTFDASASTAPDGGELTYSWTFGDGTRGGGEQIAHVYGAGGDFDVTLVVTTADGVRASHTRTVTIASAPAPSGSATVHGTVESTSGAPLDGVSVQLVDGTVSGTTDGSGGVTLGDVPVGVPVTLRLRLSGFADQYVALDIPAGTSTASFAATMRPREPAVEVVSVEAGAEVSSAGGARLELPPLALMDEEGLPVTGTVEVALTSVDVTEPDAGAFPGGFSAVESDGSPAELLSFGVSEFVISQDGQELNLAPGQTATIEIPVSVAGVSAGEELPLWSLDETLGVWVREGTGVVVVSASSPTGLALRAEVGHFSWWNIDVAMEPHDVSVRCENLGAPVTCTVKGTFQEPGQPVRTATEVVPPEGLTLPIPSGVDVTLEAMGELGQGFDQRIVNGAAGGTSSIVFDLSSAFTATLQCEDTAGNPLACTVRDAGTTDITIYENVPVGGKTIYLPSDVEVALRAYEPGGLTGEITVQGPAGGTGVFTIVLTDAFVVNLSCADRFGTPAACSVRWGLPGVGLQQEAVGTGGATILLPGDEAVVLNATDSWGVFTGTQSVQGAAGTTQSVTIDLIGQGGSFCGDASGTPLSLSVVTVTPGAACSPGVVTSPQEAILFVAHGGTIRFDDGTHQAVRLQVPRDDLTMEPVSGTSPVILPGTGDPSGYDGEGFAFLGSGSLVVRGLTFRTLGTGAGGIGFLTGPNNLNGAGAYTSFLVDDVSFEGLRIGVAVSPSPAPGAQVTIRSSRFSGSSLTPLTRAIFAIGNTAGLTAVAVDGSTFTGDPSQRFWGVDVIQFGGTPVETPVTVANSSFDTFDVGVRVLAGASHGSVILNNTFTNPRPAGRAVWVTTAPAATVTISDNTIAGAYSGADPNDPASFAYSTAVQGTGGAGSSLELQRNAISGAWTALAHDGGVLAASDLVVDQVHQPIVSQAAENVTVHQSDITNFFGAPYSWGGANPFQDGALSCNWWGDPAGPNGAGSGDAVVSPWALAPIANGSGGACTGS